MTSLAMLTWALLSAVPEPAKAPTPLAPPPAGLPGATRFELANGLRVVLIENHAAPWLEVELAYRIGSASDPAGKEGLASLAAELLTGGVPGMDEQALAETLARLGASIGNEVDARTVTLSGQVLTVDAGEARRFLDLFASVALEATLPADVLARQKTLRLAAIQHLVDNPEAVADAAVHAAVLGGAGAQAEARMSFGTLASIPTLSRDDLVAWRDRAFAPQHGVLLVAGAITPDAILAWIAARFGGATAVTCEAGPGAFPGHCEKLCRDGRCLDNPTAKPRPPRAAAGGGERVLLVAIDEPMTQIQWRYGALNPFPVTHPDWGAFRLGSHVLGGEFNARLNDILRTREGLTYGAYFSPSFGAWESGVMQISTDATTDALARSVGLGVAEYQRMGKELVPADELEATRQTLVNGFPFRFETVSDVLTQYAFVESGAVPWSWLGTWKESVGRYDAAAVRSAFQAAQSASAPVLVVVGPTALQGELGKLGRGPVTVVPVEDFLTHGLPAATP